VRTKKYLTRGGNFLFFISYFLLPTFYFLLLTAPADASEVIKKIDVEGLYSIQEEELLEILNIKAGEVLDSSKVKSGIRRAFLKGIFEDISVEVDDADRTNVKIKIKEKDVVKKVYVSGNEYLSKKFLKTHFMLKEDQFMRYDLTGDAAEGLRKILSEKGFPESDVKIQTEKTGSPYRVNILLTINEGRPEIIKSIKILGYEPARELIEMSGGDIYDQFKLRENIEEIKAYYKKNNYLKPSAGPYKFSDGNLEVMVNPGKKLDVIFENNSSVSSSDLIKEVPFFDAEDFRDDLVEEAVSRVISLYHSKGYPSAQVAPVIASGEDTITVRFFIFEGDKVVVDSVKFTGATVSEKNFKEIMSLKKGSLYNPDLVDADKKALVEFYHALGYLKASVDDVQIAIKDSKADIAVAIAEGIRTYVEGIEIKGAKLAHDAEIWKIIKIKTGDPYNEVDILDARYRIIDLYRNYGLSDAKVAIRQEFSESASRGSAKIIFEIEEGILTYFGKTVVSGNAETKSEVIKRELAYKEGAPFSYSLLNKSRQRLYKLGLFTDVDVETLEKEDSTRDVHVRVKEGNAGLVEFGVGYGDYERYRASLDISYRNLFGMNKQLSLRTEFSTLEERYIINYLEPWFLGRQLPFRIVLMKEHKTEKNIETRETRYKITRHTASAGFEKKLSERIKGELFYDFSIVKSYAVKSDIILSKEDTGTLVISGIRPGIAYDTRDNPFDPRKGVFAGISVKTASAILQSETDFVKITGTGNIYQELSKYFVLALSLRGGIAQGFGDTTDLPLIERFFLGGRTTVRGYEHDTLGPKGSNGSPTGGNAFVLTNVELRASIGKGFGLVTFMDGGNVWRRNSDIKISEMKYTAGIGIRYNTPVGPLRVDYGHKLDRETGESAGEVHFSIGHAF